MAGSFCSELCPFRDQRGLNVYFGAEQEEREWGTITGKMEARYQGELPGCTSFDCWSEINTLLGYGKGIGMDMTRAGPVANGNLPHRRCHLKVLLNPQDF